MTTPSPESRSDQPAILPTGAAGTVEALKALEAWETAQAAAEPAVRSVGEDAAEKGVPPDDDPMAELERAAVADRPLEEGARLITLLGESPEYARAATDALRKAGTDRSVEDIARLVELLTRPPRSADSADATIRAAAEHRPVQEVSRLMTLRHRTALEPHCEQEAVRTAATRRSVEELVQLMARPAEDRGGPPARWAPEPKDGSTGPRLDGGVRAGLRFARRPGRAVRPRAPGRAAREQSWPTWLTVAALAICGAAHFPANRDGASLQVYGFAFATSVLCVLLALLLTFRTAARLLAAAVLVPVVLVATELFQDRLRSPGLSRALDLSLAPSWLAFLTAVFATLTALLGLLVAQPPGRTASARPTTAASRAGD